MKTYILKLCRIGHATQSVAFSDIDVAIESAQAICAQLSAAPEGVDWQDKLRAGEIVRTSGTFTLRIDEVEFRTDAVLSDEDMPAPIDDNYDPLYCYVLMRTDVPDFLNGKAMAQAHHAGTKMVYDGLKGGDERVNAELTEWEEEATGFGTCITLAVSSAEMKQAVSMATILGLHTGVVLDPTYPIRDGNEIKTLPVKTCAYVFGRKAKCSVVVGKFPLLRSKADQ